MNEVLESYLKLLSATVKKTIPDITLSEEGWQQLFELSNRRKTTALCGGTVVSMVEKGLVNKSVGEEFKNISLAVFLRETLRLEEVGRLLQKARQAGIEPVFFKGYLLAELYPGFGLRNSSDTDFYIREEDLEKMRRICEEEYEFEEEHSKQNVYVYAHKESGNLLEMHLKLWEDYEGKKIRILEKQGFVDPENLIRQEVYGKELTTLEPTNHLIYQLFHVVKHFCVEGVGIRYLLDTVLFMEHYREQIDWDRFWKAMEELEYTSFCKQFFSLGEKWFDMGACALPEGELSLPEDEDSFLADLILAGKVSEGQKGAFQIWGIMSPYVTGEVKTSSSKLGRMMHTLFPSAENIRDDFAYAKRHKILLPIAWGHRFVDYLIYRKKHPDASYGVEEKLSAAEYRMNQLRKRGLS